MSPTMLDYLGLNAGNAPYLIAGIVIGGVLCGLLAWLLTARMKSRYTTRLAELERLSQIRENDAKALLASEIHIKEVELARKTTMLEAQEKRLSDTQSEIEKYRAVKEEYLQLQARFEEQLARQKSEQKLIEETKTVLFKEFELAANNLFEAKKQNFDQSNRVNMETVLSPFKEQLNTFNKRIEDIYHKENSQRNQLVGQIAELQKQAQQISQDANNLASALKGDNKIQGNWGEIVLERLLEQSGLEKGREYETQQSYRDEDGKRFKPDVIVHLPDNKDIVIDAKMSLLDYERYCCETEQDAREKALKAHVESIRTHIKGLSLKSYEQLEGIRTLDFVFIFVPVEAAYVLAIQSSPNLFKEAYDKNIVLVSPSSLMVALRTVETIWRYEKQNANAEAIARSAGKIYDQFVLFVEALEDVGKNIDRAKVSYNKSYERLASGRGNVLRRVETLRKLGAKATRTLSGSALSTLAEEDETDDEPEKLEYEAQSGDLALQDLKQQDA